MYEHFHPDHAAPPLAWSARTERGPRWPRVHRVGPVTAFVGTLLIVVLAIVSALTLLATTPVSIAVPVAMLWIGGLAAGGVAVRNHVASSRRARVSVPREAAVETGTDQ